MTNRIDNRCGLCGGEVSSNGICTSCGNIVTGEKTTIKSPDWGRIKINLSSCSDYKDEIRNLLVKTWNNLVKTTSQKLFSDQSLDSVENTGQGAHL